MTTRKLYRTIFQVEVLSESPVGPVELETLGHMITEGDCSGRVRIVLKQELDGRQAAQGLLAQGSDPSFFNLTEDGHETD
ncbi:MAG: hypothetical protein ACREIC_22110 [Limisphaerales bacterium]